MATRAVFLDALGTTVELEPPWLHLAPVLGLESDDATLIKAVRSEMSYYRDHAHEAHDPESLATLRARCADILSFGLDREVTIEQMMAAIRFRAFADAGPALVDLKGRGLKLICVSNWDVSLPDVLASVGLLEHFDGVISSAEVGHRKPEPMIFEEALRLAGCSADDVLHVGDTAAEDIEGAAAAGIQALLLDREGEGDIASLAEVADHLAA